MNDNQYQCGGNTMSDVAVQTCEQIAALLDREGIATGSAIDKPYTLTQRIEALAASKNYAWRQVDELRSKLQHITELTVTATIPMEPDSTE